MNTLRLILRAIVLCLAISLSCRADHLVGILPENPLLVVSTADVKRLQELPEHKVVKLIATPELRKAFGPLLTRADEALAEMQATWKKETGLEAKEVLAMFTGGASMGIASAGDPRRLAELRPTEDNMQGVIAVDFSGDEASAAKIMEALLKWEPSVSEDADDDDAE